MTFDPNSTASTDSGIFGLPFTAEEAKLHILQVPWEVTTSYGDGASRGPAAILRASRQVDLFDIETGNAYEAGYFLHDEPQDIARLGRALKIKAEKVVAAIEAGREDDCEAQEIQDEINMASRKVNDWVYAESKKIYAAGKIPALLGGDHSTPFGLIRATCEKLGGDLGILHIDAHADLRDAYQGYENSHASIMFNVMEKVKPKALVQVGIRDFSPGEFEYIQKHPTTIHTYFDPMTKRRLNRGESWQKICEEIVSKLPKNVHVSWDIDGFEPSLCPGTGTPVPGGLSFDQGLTLLAVLAESGRKIVSFDLNEVAEAEGAEDDWNGNVGARLLFKLCGWTMVTNSLTKARL